MPKYLVSYELPYVHRVSAGIEAGSEKEAIEKAERAFDDMSFWDDTPEMPLLYDDFEEADGGVLEFSAIETGEWPRRDPSVLAAKKERLAEPMANALRGLVEWARVTGGWDAPAWREAERLLRMLDDIEREQKEA